MPLNKFLSATGSPVELTYIGASSDGGGGTTYTFLSTSIGTASADRLVIVAVTGGHADAKHNLTDVTIGGVSATIHATPADPNTNDSWISCGIASLVVTTGTTATIGVTWDKSINGCSVAVYTLKDYQSSTPIDTYEDASVANATSISATIDLRGGGATVFVASLRENLSSWSSAISDYAFQDGDAGIGVAHITGDTSESGHTETMTMASSDTRSIAAVTWR